MHVTKHATLLSTVPSDIQKDIFYSKYIECLVLNFNKSITLPIYHFAYVNSLNLVGSTLPCIDILMSIVHLNQIEKLDISGIKSMSSDEIHLLLEYTPHLNHLIFEKFSSIIYFIYTY